MKQFILIGVVVSFICIGCKAKNTSQTEIKSDNIHTKTTKVNTISTTEAETQTLGLTFTPKGRKLEPPVKPKELPSGTYYCDMGTVHYARSEKGDNTCPICKMKLTLKQ